MRWWAAARRVTGKGGGPSTPLASLNSTKSYSVVVSRQPLTIQPPRELISSDGAEVESKAVVVQGSEGSKHSAATLDGAVKVIESLGDFFSTSSRFKSHRHSPGAFERMIRACVWLLALAAPHNTLDTGAPVYCIVCSVLVWQGLTWP